jgi:hypothetical protein
MSSACVPCTQPHPRFLASHGLSKSVLSRNFAPELGHLDKYVQSITNVLPKVWPAYNRMAQGSL